MFIQSNPIPETGGMTMRSFSFGTILWGLLGITCLPASALDLGGHDRDGTVIGGNVGLGRNDVQYFTPAFAGTTDPQIDLCGGLSLGWADSDAMLISLAIYGWKEGFQGQGEQMTVTAFNGLAELTWFPGGEGFWIRGGFGIGYMDFALARLPYLIEFKETGWAWSAGLGYELRIQPNVAAGLAYDYRKLQVDAFPDLDMTDARSHCLTVNLRFY